ncbi:hypothetical protein FACS18942_09420 [Planctomycetales bacterium]|nr:hypothetical protein FACS18942_09420 [Planctomycetales bacterium]
MSDGTSNTIAFSEAVAGQANQQYVKGNIAGGISTLDTNPVNTCSVAAVVDSADRNKLKGTVGTEVGAVQRGKCIADGRSFIGQFHTILPPNSPSCKEVTIASSNDGHSQNAVYSASSNHSGGVNCGLADGSVRFVSDTINSITTGTTFPLSSSTISGKSPFGIWGAYGSLDGGESVTF